MRVFLSYASDDRAKAEAIAESLKGRGHRVFFDQTDLPPGETYEDQIETAIKRSDLLVFLISPSSVAPGRFTLTELGFAKSKWPSAKGKVLPVMLAPTEFESIPAYLKGVTILTPDGNAAAETAAAADRLGRAWLRRLRTVAAVVGAVAIAGALYLSQPWRAQPKLDISSVSQGAYERGLFDIPPRDHVSVAVENVGNTPARILQFDLEVTPTEAIEIVRSGPAISEQSDQVIAPGGKKRGFFIVSNPTGAPASFRVCATFETASRLCTETQDWETQQASDYLYGDAVDLSDEVKHLGGPAIWHDDAYLVADGDRLFRLEETGDLVEINGFDGPVTALLAAREAVYVGVGGADPSVYRLGFEIQAATARLPIAFPPDVTGTFGEPLDPTPTELAHDGARLWIRTSSDAGAAALAYAPYDLSDLQLVPYFEEISFEVDNFRLRSDPTNGVILSGETNSIPSSLYEFSVDRYRELAGHDYELVSCTTDVLPRGDAVLLMACDNFVTEAQLTEQSIALTDLIDTVGNKTDETTWSDVSLAQDQSMRVLAATHTNFRDPFAETTDQVILNRVGWTTGSQMIFEAKDTILRDWAVGGSTALLFLQSTDGDQQLVLLPLDEN